MSYAEVMALTVEELLQFAKTIRFAERLEDQREARLLAPISYAIWFNQAKPNKRPKIEKYLRDLGLAEEVEELFLWEMPGASAPGKQKRLNDQDRAASAAKVKKQVVDKAQEPEEDPTGGWGDLTIVDLQAYRTEEARKAVEGRLEDDPEA